MLAYFRQDHLTAEHVSKLQEALENVGPHVRSANKSKARTSLPVALSILVPPGSSLRPHTRVI